MGEGGLVVVVEGCFSYRVVFQLVGRRSFCRYCFKYVVFLGLVFCFQVRVFRVGFRRLGGLKIFQGFRGLVRFGNFCDGFNEFFGWKVLSRCFRVIFFLGLVFKVRQVRILERRIVLDGCQFQRLILRLVQGLVYREKFINICGMNL